MKKTNSLILKYITIFLCMIFFATHLWSQDNFSLCSYEQVFSDPIEITYNGNDIPDLSGVTYNTETGKLFMVTNSPTRVYQTDLQGNVERRITLSGFNDTEGILHIGGIRFAVTEERIGNIAFFDIPPSNVDISIPYSDEEVASLPDELGPWGPNMNKGLEGVSYDPATNTIYTVKEAVPKGFYSFPLPTSLPVILTVPQVNQLCGINTNTSYGLTDLADVYHLGNVYSDNTGVLLLSEASKKLVHINENCEKIGEFSLSFMNQPEGITMDSDGNIYVVGEVNENNLEEVNEFAILRHNPSLDIDDDGVCNADDICPDGDDNIDEDNNGIPDACETCLIGDAENGDVDLSGAMNINDARMVAQYAVGLRVGGDCENLLLAGELCLQRADMDCDGEVTIADAYHIVRCVIGIESQYCPN